MLRHVLKPKKTAHWQRDPAVVAARRLERRERALVERQAARVDHPNESEFGSPEYVDQFGRQYRVAYLNRLGGWLPGSPVPPRQLGGRRAGAADEPIKLWVRLRRGDTARWWYAADANPDNRRLALRAVMPGLQAANVEVLFADRERPSRRTGIVLVKSQSGL